MNDKRSVPEDRPGRVWLHLRKSRHLGDPDDPKLLSAHESILRRLAAEDGILIPPGHVIAEIESGEFIAQRPAFRAWLETIEHLPENAGGILFCIGLDRLSRGPLSERARIQEALQRAGILVRTPSGTIDLSDPDQELLAEVKGALARQELQRFKWRLALKRREKLRRGELLTGGVPFGYDWDKNTERPQPNAQFGVLVACCQEILTISVKRLAWRYGLNPAVLLRALHSPVICGWNAQRYTMGRRSDGRRGSLALSKEAWLWAEQPGNWQAACTRAEWDQIQAVLARRYSKKEWTRSEDGWCRDVLAFRDAPPGSWVRMESGANQLLYACVDPTTRKRCAYVRRDLLHTTVTAALLPVLGDPRLLAVAQAEIQRQQSAPADFDPSVLAARLADLRRQLERSVKQSLACESEEIRAAHAHVQQELEREIKAVRRDLQQHENTPTALEIGPLLPLMVALCRDLPARWEAAPGAVKRALVNAFLAAVPIVIEPVPGRAWPRRQIMAPLWQEWIRSVLQTDQNDPRS